jgi:hypothetical protein
MADVAKRLATRKRKALAFVKTKASLLTFQVLSDPPNKHRINNIDVFYLAKLFYPPMLNHKVKTLIRIGLSVSTVVKDSQLSGHLGNLILREWQPK